MKVLIVYPRTDLYGGAELLVVRLANYLAKNKIPNALVTTNLSPEIAGDFINTRILNFNYTPFTGSRSALNLFRQWRLLRRGVNQLVEEYDVVNVHNYPAEIAVYPCPKPVVWMCNEPPRVHVRIDDELKFSIRWFIIQAILAFDQWAVRRQTKIAVVSDEYNQKRFKNIYGIDPIIINYGIDCQYYAVEQSNAVDRNDGQFTVLHVGMLTPLKNQLASLHTIERLKTTIPKIKLILAGSGSGKYLDTLREYIRNKDLQPYVDITGHVDREKIRELYRSANVLLHPIKPQGGWLSPFEAVCAGLPIVVSPEMTASSLIEKKNLGIVTQDYATALLDIYQNTSSHLAHCDYRANWVKTHLSWDNFCEQMLNAFSQVV